MLEPPTALRVAAEWRPQLPGRRSAHDIVDPIVEPAWGGARVVAVFGGGSVSLVTGGREIAVPEDLLQALLDGFLADEAVLEGHLTMEAFEEGIGIIPPLPPVARPPILVPRLGGGGREDPFVVGRDHISHALAAEPLTLEALEQGEPHAFVATDLLWIDGEPLLDIPLLERKRLLETVIEESHLVRRSAYVRPSAVVTLVAWGSLGFRDLVYKAANSRYHPGEQNPDWAIGRAPRAPSAPPQAALPR